VLTIKKEADCFFENQKHFAPQIQTEAENSDKACEYLLGSIFEYLDAAFRAFPLLIKFVFGHHQMKVSIM
jgi:hypothetical protein